MIIITRNKLSIQSHDLVHIIRTRSLDKNAEIKPKWAEEFMCVALFRTLHHSHDVLFCRSMIISNDIMRPLLKELFGTKYYSCRLGDDVPAIISYLMTSEKQKGMWTAELDKIQYEARHKFVDWLLNKESFLITVEIPS